MMTVVVGGVASWVTRLPDPAFGRNAWGPGLAYLKSRMAALPKGLDSLMERLNSTVPKVRHSILLYVPQCVLSKRLIWI